MTIRSGHDEMNPKKVRSGYASQLRWPPGQGAEVVAQGDHLLPEGGKLFGSRQFGFVILSVAADEKGSEHRGHVAEDGKGV